MADQRLPELNPVVAPALTDIFGTRQSGDTRDKRETIAQALSLYVEVNDLTAAVVWADVPQANIPDPLLATAYGSAGAPTYSWTDDPDTGMFRAGSDYLGFTVGGTQRFGILGDSFQGQLGGSPKISNSVASLTNPTFRPNGNDDNTGIGGAEDVLALIAGGVSGLNLKELNSGVIQVPDASVGVTANAGGGQGSATQLNRSYNVLASVVSAGDSVKLPPTFLINSIIFIKNDGANAADVFPASGDDLGAGTDTAVSIGVGESLSYIALVADDTWTPLIVSGGVSDPLLLGNGSAGAPSYSFTNSPTSGLYRSAADVLSMSIAGVARFEFNGDVFQSENVSGPAMVNEAISASNPVFCPNQNDLDTGLGSPGQDEVSLIAGAVEAVRYVEGSGVRILASYQLDTGLTAFAGGGNGGLGLGSTYNVITVVATAGDSVVLTAGHPKGTKMFVKNNGANAMDIFPAPGDQIDTLGVNVAVSLAPGKSALFMSTTGNDTWTMMDFDVGGGDVIKVGTPANDQVGVWTGDGTLEGNSNLRYDSSNGLRIENGGILMASGAGHIQFAASSTPELRNEGASATNPTIIPNKADIDTGLGLAVVDGLSLIAGGVEGMRITEAAAVITNESFGKILLINGSLALPSIAFTGDITTGFFSNGAASGVLNFVGGGALGWKFASNTIQSGVAGGAAIMNLVASATVPTVRPVYGDADTGLGQNAADQISLIAGGVEMARFVEAVGVEQVLILNNDNTSLPDLGSLGDPDTGLNWDVANGMYIVLGTIRQWNWSSTSYFGQNSGGPLLSNVAAGATTPTICPTRADTDTGLGVGGADALSLIAGGVEGIRVTEAAAVITVTLAGNLTITGDILANQAAGPSFLNEDATATNPTLVPNQADPDTGIGRSGIDELSIIAGGLEAGRFEDPADVSARDTSLWLYDKDNDQMEQVTVGDADSGGTGYKLLRILN